MFNWIYFKFSQSSFLASLANDRLNYTLKTDYTFVMPGATKWSRGISVMSDCPRIKRPFHSGQGDERI